MEYVILYSLFIYLFIYNSYIFNIDNNNNNYNSKNNNNIKINLIGGVEPELVAGKALILKLDHKKNQNNYKKIIFFRNY
jgi:hypothetical protein